MFRRLSEPLPLSEASLLALRPALNAPVLNVGFLPVGPARAAIVVFAEEWGGIGVSIGIRSNQGGQVAVFRNQESIEPDVTVAAALEPALAEAERMGFLFDEDMVENAATGQSEAMALWGRLMGEVEIPTPAMPDASASNSEVQPSRSPLAMQSPLDDGSSGAQEVPEFVLEDVAEVEIPEISLDVESDPIPPARVTETDSVAKETDNAVVRSETSVASEPGGSSDSMVETEPLVLSEAVSADAAEPAETRSVRPERPPQPKLSRFRNVEGKPDAAPKPAEENADSSDGSSKLGRIPLVRVRRGRDGTTRVPYLAKLLSSF